MMALGADVAEDIDRDDGLGRIRNCFSPAASFEISFLEHKHDP